MPALAKLCQYGYNHIEIINTNLKRSTMERNEISIHEARAYLAILQSGPTWITNKEIADAAKISGRTARAYSLKWKRLGIVDIAEVFPAHRCRLAEKANKRNAGYIQRLDHACGVFGLTLPSA